MTDKQTVKFGDICKEVKLTTKDPIGDGYERYIGLEHLDSGSLKIKRWGMIADDSPSFTRVFKKGQILFGKRRPYLKKAAIAEFDGICSSDIIVMETKSTQLRDTLLPYVVHSPQFWQWAIKTSAGGLSPRTKFKDLEMFTLSITCLQKQKHLEEILQASSKVLDQTSQVYCSLLKLKKTFLESNIDIGKWASLFKVENRNSYPLVKLDSVTKRGSGHTPSKKHPEYWDGGLKWISLQDSKRLDNIYISETAQEISWEGIKNSSATLHPKGTVTVCRDASIGMATILNDEMAVSQHFITWTCTEEIYPLFLYYWLQRIKPVMEAVAMGSTIKTIGMGFFESLEIPLPSMDIQVQVAESLKKIDLALNDLDGKRLKESSLQSSICSKLV